MIHITSRSTTRIILTAGLILATTAAFSATGFTLMQTQEAQISVGMSRADVHSLLGRPAHNVKYMNEPGRTWTYGVLGNGVAENTVFDVDFSADGKVMRFNERVETIIK
jgi:outer membrane protein assembly factor BamE (lipoprotein component of BamABCDE complex)